uniref:SdpI family protein n=1 Tax=Altererythrobacter segetis TaxID=1104773 RepID=UPI0014083D1C|nr:SdpI family protein [Altererythrobacter segetis]
MKNKGLLIASLIVVSLMAGFAFYAASLLPAGAQLPTHWGPAGNPDSFANALPALLMMPGIMLLISAFFAAVPYLDPLQDKLEGSQPLLRTVWIGMLALLPVIEVFNAAPAFGWPMPNSVRLISVGLLLMVIGNALPKSRPGFFVGIRTPWTITDTDNWIATHRLGGKLMVLGGLVIALSALIPLAGQIRVAVFFVTIAAMVVPPLVYSWWFWRRKKTHA